MTPCSYIYSHNVKQSFIPVKDQGTLCLKLQYSLRTSQHTEFGVEDFAEAVADERETRDAEHDEESREDRDPPFAADDILAALRDHKPPFRGGEFRAQADEA